MADNLPATSNAGITLATDDIAGVHYPRSKVTWGPDGTANDVDTATGKPLPVQLRTAAGVAPSNSAPLPALLYDADGNEILGQQDAAAWNKTDASTTLIAIEKAATLELEAIKNAVTSTTAVSITKALNENARTDITFGVSAFATTATADTVIGSGWAFSVDGGAVDTSRATDYLVPSGKRLRILSLQCVGTFPTTHTTAGALIVTIRAATSGTISTSSPRQFDFGTNYGTVAYSVLTILNTTFPGAGWELPADTRLGASVALNQITWNTTTNAPRITLNFVGHLYDDTP